MKALLILAAIFFILATQGLALPSVNLDDSWTIALQVAYEKGLIFGKEFIFTYGPLGFLSTRVAAESTKFIIVAYDIFLILQLMLIPFFIMEITASIWTICMIFIAYLTLGTAYYLKDPAVILFLLSTFWIFYDKFKVSNLAFILGLINALLVFYVKVNLGLAALLQVTAIVLLSLCNNKRSLHEFLKLSAIILSLLLSTLLLKVDLFGYLRASLHMANGFNDAMYIKPADAILLYLAVGLFSLLLIVSLISLLKEKYLLLVLSCLGFSFLLFKQAFVRADEHIYVFFDYISIPFAMLALYAEKPTRIFNTCIFFAVSIFILYNKNLTLGVFEAHYNMIPNYFASLNTDISQVKPEKKLPISVIQQIGNSSVDLMPDNTSLLYFAGLNYVPRPVIQSYAAFDGFLDMANANFIRNSGQQFEVLSHGCIDYRYCLWDESETKIALLENYKLNLEEQGYLLLSRNNTPTQFKRTLIKKGKSKLESELKIQSTGNIQVIKFFIEYSPRGKATRFFYKAPPLNVLIKTAKDRATYRAVLPIVQAGVIANLDIKDSEGLKNLFSGNLGAITPVESLRFQTDHNWAFKNEYSYEIYELTL
jgi:hypothetical protein